MISAVVNEVCEGFGNLTIEDLKDSKGIFFFFFSLTFWFGCRVYANCQGRLFHLVHVIDARCFIVLIGDVVSIPLTRTSSSECGIRSEKPVPTKSCPHWKNRPRRI